MSPDKGNVNGRCLKIGLQLLKLGYWIVAIRPGEKRPIGVAWGAERWSPERLREAFEREHDAGIGICFGPGRGPGGVWLIDVEGDGPQAGESLSKLLGGDQVEVQTVAWSSTRGSHWLFAVEGGRLLGALKAAGAKEQKGSPGVWHLAALPDLEFRVGGVKEDETVKQLQSVCPPTPGTDGNPRAWIGSPRDGVCCLPTVAYEYLASLGYGRSALEGETAAVAIAKAGERHAALLQSTLRLASLVKAGKLSEQAALDALHDAARSNGLADEGRAAEVDDLWASAMGMASARKVKARPPATAGVNGHDPHLNGAAEPPKRLIILASEVTPRRVEWLWPDRIPIGKLTTFAGWGGLGKSFVTMDLAARISRGGEIPGMAGECFERSRVLILNTEDDPDDTSVPRLMEVGADLGQIGFARSEVLGQFTLADLRTLDLMLGQLGEARLLIIDPATAHLGTANDHKNAELRGLLMPLSLWAMERRIAVILVTHVNKPQAGKVDAMARVVGSVAWVNAVRAAVMFAKDPDDRTRRLFIPFKTNNSPEQRGLAYRIQPTGTLARVEWLGEVDTSADDALSPEGRTPRRVEAAEWLVERFSERLRWHSDDLFSAAKEAGISRNAMFEAKKFLDLPACKQEMTLEGERIWVWWVDADWQGFQKKR